MSPKKALMISFLYMVGGIVIVMTIQRFVADRRMANGMVLVATIIYSLIVFGIAAWFKSRS